MSKRHYAPEITTMPLTAARRSHASQASKEQEPQVRLSLV